MEVRTHTHKYVWWYVLLYEDRERIRVRQPAVRYTQKSTQISKQKKPAYLCVFDCMCVCGARANQRHTRHHRSSRVCE